MNTEVFRLVGNIPEPHNHSEEEQSRNTFSDANLELILQNNDLF